MKDVASPAASAGDGTVSSILPLSRGQILRLVFLAFLTSRVFQAFFVYLGHMSHPYLEKIEGGFAGVPNWWLNPWTTFDSAAFLGIADEGYTPERAAFFPLYPLILRLFGPNDVWQSFFGVLVSSAAFLVGLYFVYRLTAIDWDEKTAKRAVWLLAFYPAAATFSSVYTEGVFLFLITGAFLSARLGRWGMTAGGAFLAALCRNSGPVVAVSLAVDAWQFRKERPVTWWKMAPAIVLPVLAFASVQLYFSTKFAGLSGLDVQRKFLRAPSLPWVPLWRDTLAILSGRSLEIVTLLNYGATLAGIAVAVWLWRQRRWSYAVLLTSVLLMQLSFSRFIPPYTVASLRYMATTFPFIQVIALWSLRWTTRPLTTALLATMYLLLGAAYSYLWGIKSFLG